MSAELIEKLDPHRDYGERTYTDIVREVESGSVRISDNGPRMPILRDSSSGLPVKGSGAIFVPEKTNQSRSNARTQFMLEAEKDFQDVYQAMITSAKKGEVRAQKLFMELYVGRPKEVSEGANEKMMDKLLDLALKPKEEVIEVISES